MVSPSRIYESPDISELTIMRWPPHDLNREVVFLQFVNGSAIILDLAFNILQLMNDHPVHWLITQANIIIPLHRLLVGIFNHRRSIIKSICVQVTIDFWLVCCISNSPRCSYQPYRKLLPLKSSNIFQLVLLLSLATDSLNVWISSVIAIVSVSLHY